MKKMWFTYVIISSFFILVLNFVAYSMKKEHIQQYSDTYKRHHIVEPIMATIASNAKNAYAIYTLYVVNDDVLSLVSRASKTNDDAERNQLRQKLYNKLKNEYQVFKSIGIKQFHFHFKDATSFLRFHKPNKYGDNLSKIRPSIVLANKEQKFVQGFEEGRIFNGYRYVFPLQYKGEHIGSVEVSVGFNTIAKILNDDFSLEPYMILHEQVVEEKVFTKEKQNYEKSFLSDKYYHEYAYIRNPKFLHNDDDQISVETFYETLRKFKNRFSKKLEKNEFFQHYDIQDDFAYIISFYPIKNITGKNIGYIVLMDKDNEVVKIENTYLFIHVSLTLGILLVIWFILRLGNLNNSLKQATLAKSEFLANMSHEIRTPLNAIFGFLNLLRKLDNSEKQKEYLTTIYHSSETLLSIINDILDFSKIESGKFTFEITTFNYKEFFEQIYKMFLPLAQNKKIDLQLKISGESIKSIQTDKTRLKQVITNLVSNAIKFTDENGKVDIEVECNSSTLNVKVIDNGIGIPQDRQDKVFMKFEQADNSTTRKYGGTGLGLAISNYIISGLGGELKLQSTVNEGSTFYFNIPIEVSDEKTISNSKVEANEQTFSGKILLVEDNKTNQMMMKIILDQLGLEVDIANDGLEAIEAYKTSKYDLILMDENMPNMNGIEATKKIIQLEHERYEVPIVALTADAVNNARERYLKVGMKDYLAKPLDEKELVRVLNNYL